MDSLGAELTTDTGGDLGIGFRKEGKWVYEISGMFKQPVITMSLPDRVAYFFEPFENIRVSVLFIVWSSRLALIEMSICNTGSSKVSLDVFPFIRSCRSGFSDIEIFTDPRIFSFRHVEKPDSWTLAHQLPIVDSIRNILMLSEKPDEVIPFIGSLGRESGATNASRLYAFKKDLELGGGGTHELRMVRGVCPVHENADSLVAAATSLINSPAGFNPGVETTVADNGNSLSFQSKELFQSTAQ